MPGLGGCPAHQQIVLSASRSLSCVLLGSLSLIPQSQRHRPTSEVVSCHLGQVGGGVENLSRRQSLEGGSPISLKLPPRLGCGACGVRVWPVYGCSLTSRGRNFLAGGPLPTTILFLSLFSLSLNPLPVFKCRFYKITQ